MKWLKELPDEAYWCVIIVVFLITMCIGHCVEQYYKYLKVVQGGNP